MCHTVCMSLQSCTVTSISSCVCLSGSQQAPRPLDGIGWYLTNKSMVRLRWGFFCAQMSSLVGKWAQSQNCLNLPNFYSERPNILHRWVLTPLDQHSLGFVTIKYLVLMDKTLKNGAFCITFHWPAAFALIGLLINFLCPVWPWFGV